MFLTHYNAWCKCLVWINCNLLGHPKSSTPRQSSSAILIQFGIALDKMMKQSQNGTKHTEQTGAKPVATQFRTYWLLSVQSSGIRVELSALGSANECVSVGGELGSSEQQNEGRLLVSGMASGLQQQQEAELCRPAPSGGAPAKSPISREKCWSQSCFSGNSELSALYPRLADALLKTFNNPQRHDQPLQVIAGCFVNRFFLLPKQRVWTSEGWTEALVSRVRGPSSLAWWSWPLPKSSLDALCCFVAALF